ncbi:nuclear transport factor 2 family protein [Antrihabitans cavernicola]|uniref:Nuclear transport factor 2 family protein n=1 Tax=Antrihabitans cavernicola TaxID=2495913 RepID=A0A5A7S6L4_9NOCA|nr:nuclear transport factor 2 family protein [Spelaeibacter cavernicola]KAA0020030.1 nuclear transport factor 2 family protein [Spelaeibacter cavernicola]
MSDFDQIAAQYIAVWNETDAVKRRQAIDTLWAADGRYVDPMAAASGRDEIDATIGAVQQQFAGLTFRLVGAVDAHHDQARFQWELGPDGVEAPIVGFDVVEANSDGQLTQVLGFLDKVPAA